MLTGTMLGSGGYIDKYDLILTSRACFLQKGESNALSVHFHTKLLNAMIISGPHKVPCDYKI